MDRIDRRTVCAALALPFVGGCLRMERTDDSAEQERTSPERVSETPDTGQTETASDDQLSDESDDPPDDEFDPELGPKAAQIRPPLRWPTPAADEANRGREETATAPAQTAALQWTDERDPASFASGSPLGTDAHVLMIADDTVEALSIADGTVSWESNLINASLRKVADGLAYVTTGTSDEYSLVGYDVETGTERSRIDIGGRVADLAIADGTAYVLSIDHRTNTSTVVAQDVEDGRTLWTAHVEDVHLAPLAVEGDSVYVGGEIPGLDFDEYDGMVVAFDRATGEERWRFGALNRVESPVVTDGDVVYAACSDGREVLHALDADDGSRRWVHESLNGTKAPPVVGEEFVYYGTTDEVLYAVDPDDGRESWRFETGGRIENSYMAMAGRTLYVPCSFAGDGRDRSRLIALDVERRERAWSVTFDNRNLSSVALAGNVVFVGTTDFGYTDTQDRYAAFSAGPTED